MRIKVVVGMVTVLLIGLVSPVFAGEIHDAVRQGDIDAVKALIEQDPGLVSALDSNEKTPLHFAAESGHAGIAELLLAKGVKVDAKTVRNTTALHYAAAYGHLPVVELLVNSGAGLENRNVQTATPLYFAAAQGHLEVVTFLIEKGAVIDAADGEETTPLQNAAQRGHLEIAKLLMEKGADINAKDITGKTTMHYACIGGSAELVEILLDGGLKTGEADQLGKTPLFYAAAGAHNDVVDLLFQKGKKIRACKGTDGNTLLHAAATGGILTLARRLVEEKSEINVENAYGVTPLHLAAQNGRMEVVSLLIENRADLDAKTKAGLTPHSAARAGDFDEIADALAAAGADTSAAEFPEYKGDYFGSERPGSLPELFAPGIVSTGEQNERDASFSKNLREFYFTRRASIHYSKLDDGRSTAPELTSFSGKYADFEAYFTPDDQEIFFISTRPRSGSGDPESFEIWRVKRENDGWGTPGILGSPFEGGFYTTFTNDWVMYLTLDSDIYRARYVNGAFETPERLDDNINTSGAEYNSFIAPDGSYLIYSSDGRGDGVGTYDMYINYRKEDGSWTPAINMGEKVNSIARDYCPSVSPDGKYFFFASGRLGTEDIFWMDAKIIEELRPAE